MLTPCHDDLERGIQPRGGVVDSDDAPTMFFWMGSGQLYNVSGRRFQVLQQAVGPFKPQT